MCRLERPRALPNSNVGRLNDQDITVARGTLPREFRGSFPHDFFPVREAEPWCDELPPSLPTRFVEAPAGVLLSSLFRDPFRHLLDWTQSTLCKSKRRTDVFREKGPVSIRKLRCDPGVGRKRDAAGIAHQDLFLGDRDAHRVQSRTGAPRAGHASQSGLNNNRTPKARITRPLTSFSQRPSFSWSLRCESVTTAMVNMMTSSNMYATL